MEKTLGPIIAKLNPLTGQFQYAKTEKRVWVIEFIEAVGCSALLAEQETSTLLRQAFILLDNSVEQFMKSYLQIEKNINIKKGRSLSYFDLTQSVATNVRGTKKLMKRIFDNHETRNNLYHQANYQTVSKDRYNYYLADATELAKKTINIDLVDLVLRSKRNIMKRIRTREYETRLLSLQKVSDMIKDEFGITPGQPTGDILLGSVSGYTQPAIDSFKTILLGALGREAIGGKKARVLELIDGNEENAMHTFFISYSGGKTWYCFYRCMWSKWGEGDDRNIKQLRKLIKEHSKWIDYKTVYAGERFYRGAFDPFYGADRDAGRYKS